MALDTKCGRPFVGAALLAGAVLGGALSICALPVLAGSQTAGGVTLLHSHDVSGAAVVEFTGQPNKVYRCAVLDHAGTEIAQVTAMSHVGTLTLPGIAAETVAALRCRAVM